MATAANGPISLRSAAVVMGDGLLLTTVTNKLIRETKSRQFW